MGMPTTVVEVAFTTNPGATPTWTDVSAYLKAFTVHRGRADELSAFNGGQASITLDNVDRRFDPSYTSSPYSPNVIPMRRIRIRATYNAITYDVFNGYVTNWRQVYSPPQEAECVLEATDAFKVLANIVLPASAYDIEVAPDGPDLWWSLGEPAGSTVVYDRSGNNRTGTMTGTAVTFGSAGLIAHDPDRAATFTQTTGAYISAPTGLTLDQATPWAVELWFQPTATPATWILVSGGPAGPTGGNVLSISTTATAVSFTVLNDAGGSAGSVTLVTTLNVGQAYHLVFTHDSDRILRIYVDGALAATAGAAGAGTFSLTRLHLGPQPSSASLTPNAVIDEFAIYQGGATTALSTARIAAHRAAGYAPWSGDLTGTRVGRILDAAGWPTADRNLDAGSSTLQPVDLGTNALDALQDVEQTEFGALFVTAAGLVRFIGRQALQQAPYTTSQGTFGDFGAELEFGDLTFEYDDNLIVNEAYVSRTDGLVQTASDAASQTKYLRRTKVVSGLLHQSDITSLDAANWIVAHYKDPILRVTGMRLEPSAGNETTHFPHALGRELMERVTVNRRPQNLGAAITQDSQIQGIEHSVTPTQWVTTWNLSPAETQVYWILGTAGLSELDQTTRLGF